MTHVRWLGAAGLEITHNGETLLIDPYLSRLGKTDLFFRRNTPDKQKIVHYLERLPGKLSGIVIGHTHFDHAFDIPEICRYFDGPVIGSESLDTLLSIHGLGHRVSIPRGIEVFKIGNAFSITMIPSCHGLVLFGKVPCPGDIKAASSPPLKASEYRVGRVFIPRIEIEGKTFVHAGSANLSKATLSCPPADVLFMCVPGWKKNPLYTTSFLKQINPETVIPFHFDDFSAPLRPDGTPRRLPFLNEKRFIRKIKETLPTVTIKKPAFMVPIPLSPG